MTQEEKFEEAKRLYETANADQRYVLESLFPELAESEDERIRKALIKFFTLSDDNADYQCCGVHYKDIVAWLERQEYKPIEWSEEDESHIKRIIEHFEGRKKDLKTQWVAELHNKEIDWLKSIKDRVQPKQEWSESDKDRIGELVVLIQHSNYTDGVKRKVISWLDSLKDRVQPQSQWKPSDEQIKSLNYVVNLMASSESPKENDYYYNVFKDLRKQLKKLREE